MLRQKPLPAISAGSRIRKTKVEAGAAAEAASDFEALEHLRRLMFTDRVPQPEQLRMWAE